MFRIVIPARYASTRLPGKPLADIAGKPMVVRVADAVAGVGATSLQVATDDGRVAEAVTAHGVAVTMTRADHATGAELYCADTQCTVYEQCGDLCEPSVVCPE